MFPGAEEDYREIGQRVFDLAPDGFREAFVRVEMTDDVGSIGVFYQMPDGTYTYRNQGFDAVLDAFRSLRDRFTEGQAGVWSTATFRLSAEGRMNLDIGYEDVSDFGLSSERRNAWIRKNLGDDAVIHWS